jgi:hypothetical protein
MPFPPMTGSFVDNEPERLVDSAIIIEDIIFYSCQDIIGQQAVSFNKIRLTLSKNAACGSMQ